MHAYVAFAVISFLVGLGALRWCGKLESSAALTAQAVGQAILTLASLGATQLGPLDDRAWIAWSLAFVLLGFGAATAVQERRVLRGVGPELLAGLVLPCLVLWARTAQGFFEHPGTIAFDGWGYVVMGDHLRELARGTQGGLSIAHEFGAELTRQRCASGAWLAFIAPVGPDADNAGALTPYVAMALSSYVASVGAAAANAGLVTRWRLVAQGLAALALWPSLAVALNNLDHLLFLGFIPALVVFVSRASWPGAGLLAASAFVTYPELCPLIFLAVTLMIVLRWRRTGELPAGPIVRAVVTFLVLAGPFIPRLVSFALAQFALAKTGAVVRPGEGIVPELLRPMEAVAVWWGRAPVGPASSWSSWLPGALWGLYATALTVKGGLTLWRRGDMGPVALLLVGWSVASIMLAWSRYDYAAYKFLLTSWWAACLALTCGLATWDLRPRRGPLLAGIALGVTFCLLHTRLASVVEPRWDMVTGLVAWSLVLVSAILVSTARRGPTGKVRGRLAVAVLLLLWAGRQAASFDRYRDPAGSREHYTCVRQVEQVARGRPVYLCVDDDVASQWAVHYLRRSDLRLGARRAYLAPASSDPLVARARNAGAPPPDDTLLLLDATARSGGRETLWAGGAYKLVRTGPAPWACVVGLQALERGAPVDLAVIASEEGLLELTGRALRAGALTVQPLDLGLPPWTVGVSPGPSVLRLQVPRGTSRWRVSPRTPGDGGSRLFDEVQERLRPGAPRPR